MSEKPAAPSSDADSAGEQPRRAPRTWFFSPGKLAEKWPDFRDNHIAAIGDGEIGDLRNYKTQKEIEEKLYEKYKYKEDKRKTADMLFNFCNEVHIGDIFLVKNGRKKIIARGIVKAEYKFDNSYDYDYWHTREMEWTDIEYELKDGDILSGGKLLPQKTLANADDPKYANLKKLYENLADQEGNTMTENQKTMCENHPLNQILYGPPGTGKTYSTVIRAVAIIEKKSFEAIENEAKAKEGEGYNEVWKRFEEYREKKQVDFITFHQSYSYEEFVEGIKPHMADGKEGITYEIKSGIFKNICEAAKKSKENYVLIIDEINRGNISKIFGELITLIEDDKRDKLTATLPYSQNTLTVPKNLFIIGTMNTADRSIAALDIALRRRFRFIEMMPNSNLLQDCPPVEGINLKNLTDNLNDKIAVLIDRDHQIGHAYFMNITTVKALKEAWFYKILPLLNEYFYGDWHKLQLLVEPFLNEEKIPDALKEECVDEKFYSFKSEKDYTDADFISDLKKILAEKTSNEPEESEEESD